MPTLPLVAVLLRLVLLAGPRPTLVALLPLALAGLGLAAAYWSRPLGDPFLLVPCIVLLALMVGFGQSRGVRALLVLLVCLSLAALPSLFALRDLEGAFLTTGVPILTSTWLLVADQAIVLGLFVRLVSWALRRDPGLALLGGLVGAATGLAIAEHFSGPLLTYLASSGPWQWKRMSSALYLDVCLGYAGAVIGGLLARLQRP